MLLGESPSYRSNFYSPKRGGVAAYPKLWRDLVAAWVPALGCTGSILRDQSGLNFDLDISSATPTWTTNRYGHGVSFGGVHTAQAVASGTQQRLGGPATIVYSTRFGTSDNAATSIFNLDVSGGPAGNAVISRNATYGDGKLKFFHEWSSGVVSSGSVDDMESVFIFRRSGSTSNWTIEIWIGGKLDSSATEATYNPGETGSQTLQLCGVANSVTNLNALLIYNRAISYDEIQLLSANPIAPFELDKRRAKATEAAGGGIVGTAAITEADDTLTSAATIALAAVLAVTEADDTSTSTATIALAATLAATEADDTLTSAAAISIVATSAITEADDSLSSTATIAIVATATITEAGDTLASEATIADDERNAVLAITEADDTVTSTATISLVAVVAITEADDAITSTAGLAIVAVSAVTEASDTLSSASTIGLADPIWTIDLSLTGRRTATCLAVTTARSTAFACQYNDGVPAIAAGYGFLVEADGDYLVDSDGNYLIASV